MTHILIVSAEFYPEISAELKKGATTTLKKAKATYDIAAVPGAFEIPAVIGFAIAGKKYHGYLALGCVIRGETTHYDYVCGESARGLMDLAVQKNAAIGYGILTVENMKQAKARAKVTKGNKGKDSAEACLRLIELKKKLCKA
jgi:6,7-dimethyl-8-ribityllumazine synthase